MVSPGTVEDSEREEQLNDKISQTRDILDLIDSANVGEDTKNDVLVKLLKDFVSVPDIANIVEKSVFKDDDSSADSEDVSRDIADSLDELDNKF